MKQSLRNISIIFLAVIGVVALTSSPASAQAAATIPVDLELSLVIDISGSVSASEYATQIQGYGNAFKSAAVINALDNGQYEQIAVNVVFYSGSAAEVVEWTLVDQSNSSAFGDTLIALADPNNLGSLTGVANAIDTADNLFFTNIYEGDRLVMDVSGDGIENVDSVADVLSARDIALALGIDAINGLVIDDETGVVDFYADNVVGGDGAFLLVVDSFDDLQPAIIEKLAREIGDDPVVPEPATLSLLGFGLMGLAGFRKKRS